MKNQTEIDVTQLTALEEGGKTILSKLSAVEYLPDFPEDEFPAHQTTNILPMMRPEELAALETSVRERGIQKPVVVWVDEKQRKYLVNGRNRALVFRKLKAESYLMPDGSLPVIPVQYLLGSILDVFDLVFEDGVGGCRQMNVGQRAAVGYLMMLENERVHRVHAKATGQARPKRKNGEGDAAEIWANKIGCNRGYFFTMKQLVEANLMDLVDQIRTGAISMKEAIAEKKRREREVAAALAMENQGVQEPGGEEAPPVEPTSITVLDGEKRAVDPPWHRVFLARTKEVPDLMRATRALATAMSEFAQHPGGLHLPAQQIEEHLSAVASLLHDSQPHVICPEPGTTGETYQGCGGTGKKGGHGRGECPLCGGRKYLSTGQFRTLKRALQKEKKAQEKANGTNGHAAAEEHPPETATPTDEASPDDRPLEDPADVTANA